jgi:hypothetical protein
VTTINEARDKLRDTLAAYQADHPPPLRPEAHKVIDRLLSKTNDAPTLFAFERIEEAWPTKPVRPSLSPDGVTDITGRLDEFILPPYWSLVDALVAGLVTRATVGPKVGDAKRVRAAILEAEPHLHGLELFASRVEAPEEVRDALRFLRGYVETREEEAYRLLGVVKREGLKPGTGKAALDGRTREGLRQSVLRIKSMAPKAANEDIERVLAAAFDLMEERADGVKVIDAKALTERRPKSEKEKEKAKALRAEQREAKAKAKLKARPKPRPLASH